MTTDQSNSRVHVGFAGGFLVGLLLFFSRIDGTNSIIMRSMIRTTIIGITVELLAPHFCISIAIHPIHGMRIITLPTTKFSGTPGGEKESQRSKPEVGCCGHGFPFPSPFVWKYVVPFTIVVPIIL